MESQYSPSEVYSLVLVGGVPPAFKFCRPPFLPQVSERAIPKSTQHSWIGMGRRLHFESEDYLPSRDSNWAQKNLKESEAAEGIGNRHFPLGSCFLILTSSSSPLSHMGNVKVETLIRKKNKCVIEIATLLREGRSTMASYPRHETMMDAEKHGHTWRR